MQPALLIRLQPSGPWRFGAGDGSADQLDELYRSDRVFSAVTLAMQRLGFLEEWLQATVYATEPAIAFSSFFPFQGDTLFAIPPATLWPPPTAQVTAPNSVFLAKIRWRTARFVPLSIIDLLITGGVLLADQWLPDPESGCLLRRDRPNTSPFRTVTRTTAAVDRITQTAGRAITQSCMEFEPGAGLWVLARFRNNAAQSAWNDKIEGAFRLLADSGFGGKRSNGWGHSRAPEFQRGTWPVLLLPKAGRRSTNVPASERADTSQHWLLSLFSPSPTDKVDWQDGDYKLTVRSGRIESHHQSGTPKKAVRMVAEGSVIIAAAEPTGAALDVAPDGFGHPVFRSGLALSLELPSIAPQPDEEVREESQAVEEPATEEAVIELPCETTPDQQLKEGKPPSTEPTSEQAEPAPVPAPASAESDLGPAEADRPKTEVPEEPSTQAEPVQAESELLQAEVQTPQGRTETGQSEPAPQKPDPEPDQVQPEPASAEPQSQTKTEVAETQPEPVRTSEPPLPEAVPGSEQTELEHPESSPNPEPSDAI